MSNCREKIMTDLLAINTAAVAEYTLVEALIDNWRGGLPTVQEIENDFQQVQDLDGGRK